MTTNIECTKCQNVISVFADSVQLPFICGFCITGESIPAGVEPAQVTPEIIAEAEANTEPCDLPEFDVNLDVNPDEQAEDFHDTATVENTTLLIEDLEQQLSNANVSNEQLYSIGERLNNELFEVREDLAAHQLTLKASVLAGLKLSQDLINAEAREEFAHTALANRLTIIGDLKTEINNLKGLLDAKDKDLVAAKASYARLDDRRTYWIDRAKTWIDRYYSMEERYEKKRKRLAALEGRGFWARLFNVDPEAK